MVLLVIVLSVLLALPGWVYARRHQGASWLLLFLSVPAGLAWQGLLVFGVNRGGVGNLLFEPPALIAMSGLFVYAQVFLLDRWLPKHSRTTQSLAVALVALAIGIRLFAPAIRE